MTKVLVVEDEVGLVALLTYNLEKEGFDVVSVMDGALVLDTVLKEKPDVILMDWMLPNVSGVDLCKSIRENAIMKDIPIIMVTARAEEADKVQGLSFGADDYMTKPFSMPELFARVKALLRRVGVKPQAQVLTVGVLTLDYDKKLVLKEGKPMHMGPTEFRLLSILMEQAGHVFSREELLQLVWGESVFVEPRTVDVHIRRLRRNLEDDKAELIRTVRSAGYAVKV